MRLPLVSIIIPVYNSNNYLNDTLSSVKNQKYQNWECIIVDDKSSDNSLEIAKRFELEDDRFRIFQRPDLLIKGANSCRNYGFENARGEFINWFDSDDIMLADFILKKINSIEDKVDVIISSGYFTDCVLDRRKKMSIFQTNNLYQDYFLWKIKIVTNSVMFRKEFLTDKELFNIHLKKGQEFELFTRAFINLKNNQYKIIEDSLFLYRSNPNSITSTNQKYNFCFKESEVYSISENFKASIKNKNFIVAKSAYRLLINLLQKALANNHLSNVNYIYNGIKYELGEKNKLLVIILFLIIKTSKFINISILNWDKIIKRYPIIF